MNLVCMHCLYENFNVIKWFTFCLHAATASGLFFRFCFLQLEVAGPHCHRVSSFRNESVLLVCREILCSAHSWSAGRCKWSCRACCETENSWRFVFFPPESQKTLTELTALNTHTHTEPSCKIIWLVSNCSSAQDAQCQTSVANISPMPADVVIVIRRCVCGAPVRCPALAHARRDTQTCTVNTSRINPWLANKILLLWATILISQWSNSKQIRVCDRVCVCPVSTATSGPQQSQAWPRLLL